MEWVIIIAQTRDVQRVSPIRLGLTDAEFVCLSKNMTALLREAR